MRGSLTYSELVRFVRRHLWASLGVSIGIGFLIQLSGADGTGGEKRIFFNMIFSFWMGITLTVHWFGSDREYIRRLRRSGVSMWKILFSRTPVLFSVALIHATVLYGLSSFMLTNHGAVPSKASGALNSLRYSSGKLDSWGNEDSDFYTVEYEDESLRDREFRDKVALGAKYTELQRDGTWCVLDRQTPIPAFARWYAFLLASLSGSWIGVVLAFFFIRGLALKLIPFVTAVQIMFAELTTDASKELFCPIAELFSTYEWWEPAHVVSLLTPMRYLVELSGAQEWRDIFWSWDSIIVYIMMLFCFAAAAFARRKQLSLS